MQQKNHQVVLARPLSGVPLADDFRVQAVPVPEPGPGQLLVRHIHLSLDPYQRSAIAGRHMASRQPLGAGAMPMAETVGQVLRSRHPGFREGDYVRHFGGWQEYALSSGEQTEVIEHNRAPLSAWLGVLGMPGLTAWASMVALADVQPGQVVLVSAALGPVGSMVGQLAIQRGARAVGIAGSDEKCAFVRELGFGACINYRSADFLQTLAAALPEGADIYHDNVGGQMLADAFTVLKNYGTVILCGLMERYNDPALSKPLDLALPIIKRAVMKGLVVTDFEERRGQFVDFVAPRIADGRIRYREDRATGIAATGAHFARLMRGENLGKSIVVLADEAHS
ncbi:MAG: NADP-dependent oxidoreductase [Gammaproteobacteria bacterium]|nr:NADP-dependent oxidoreductase [Gammaproteobacteria bacterium]